MRRILLILSTLALAGCASASKTFTPEGKEGYFIDCSGAAFNWGMCYEKAGKICGSKGYEVLQESGDKGAMISAGQFGLFGGSVITRSMLIKCKE